MSGEAMRFVKSDLVGIAKNTLLVVLAVISAESSLSRQARCRKTTALRAGEQEYVRVGLQAKGLWTFITKRTKWTFGLGGQQELFFQMHPGMERRGLHGFTCDKFAHRATPLADLPIDPEAPLVSLILLPTVSTRTT